METSSFGALRDVVLALQRLEIEYMLVGAFSSNAYGFPRSTNDADIVIQYQPGAIGRLYGALGDQFELDPQTGFEVMTGSLRDVIRYVPTRFEIELFRLTSDPHDQSRFARRRRLTIAELQIEAVIPTAEDVVIQKLRWQRDKDLADVRVVVGVQFSQLDWAYLLNWTDQHGTTELLNRIRTEVIRDAT